MPVNTNMIYESPDGGKTVYAKEGSKRILIQTEGFTWNNYVKLLNWNELSKEALIKDALEKLKVVTTLC